MSISTIDAQNVSANKLQKTYLEGSVEVTFDIVSQWEGYYNANVTIKNVGNTKIDNWYISISLKDKIENIWNAKITEENEKSYIIKNVEWNQDINKGKSIQFGITCKGDFEKFPSSCSLLEGITEINLDKVNINYNTDYSWEKGYNGRINITNNMDKDIEDWVIEFDLKDEIVNIWDANIISHIQNHYVIGCPNSKQNIKVGETVTVGFSVENAKSDKTISNFKIMQHKPIENSKDGELIELTSNKKEVMQNNNVIFYAKLNSNKKKLYIMDLQTKEIITELKDDGDYENNGDDIQGDGIWSGRYNFINKIYSRDDDDNRSNILSNEVIIIFIPSITNNDLDNREYVASKIKEVFDLYEGDCIQKSNDLVQNSNNMNGIDNVEELKATFDELLNKLESEGHIQNFTYDNESGIYKCAYQNGNNFFVSLGDILFGDDSTFKYKTEIDSDYSGYSAVIMNAFENEKYRMEFYEELVNDWQEKGMAIEYDDVVTVSDMKNKLSHKDIIMLSGHGYRSMGKSYFCLMDESVSKERTISYSDDIAAGRVVDSYFTSGSAYCINDLFFKHYYNSGQLKGSFIFSEACTFMGESKVDSDNLSYYNDDIDNSFAETLLECGAESVVGFFNSVMADYSREFMVYYFEKLLEGKTSDEAFECAVKEYGKSDYEYRKPSFWEYLVDRHAFEKMGYLAFPVFDGNKEATLIKNIFSEDWESPLQRLCFYPVNWRCIGDVRVISNLGEIVARGSKMAFISTGIGSKEGEEIYDDLDNLQGSVMYQTVRNLKNDIIEFDYDFISEEPMEFVNTEYDDKFEVQILDIDNNILSSSILETVNTSNWKYIEGINFDGGDDTVYHTDWKKGTIDISQYHDKVIKIKFLVYDVGDSQFDSAVVLDNIIIR